MVAPGTPTSEQKLPSEAPTASGHGVAHFYQPHRTAVVCGFWLLLFWALVCLICLHVHGSYHDVFPRRVRKDSLIFLLVLIAHSSFTLTFLHLCTIYFDHSQPLNSSFWSPLLPPFFLVSSSTPNSFSAFVLKQNNPPPRQPKIKGDSPRERVHVISESAYFA